MSYPLSNIPPYTTSKTLSRMPRFVGIVFAIGVSASFITACDDRTKPDPEAIVPEVDIEQTEPLTAGKSVGDANIQVTTDDETSIMTSLESDPMHSPAAGSSIVTSEVSEIKEGTPESVLAKAMNTIYYGNAIDAAPYYQTSMPDFEQQLINTQAAFQKTVKKVVIHDITYNEDKTEAILKGTISLIGVDKPDEAEFHMEKVNGDWKILG